MSRPTPPTRCGCSVCKMWTDYIEKLDVYYREVLVECRDELDYFYDAEYPGDHPHFVKERNHLKANNPARVALGDAVPDDYRTGTEEAKT